MAISFNSIPTSNRVPFVFVEFDSSGAVRGPTVQRWKALLFGQMLGTGTAVADKPILVTSREQARTLFGTGSMLAQMYEAFRASNATTDVWAIPQADAGAGTAATGTVTFTGTATATGTVDLYIAGQHVAVAVASGAAAATVATDTATAINALTTLPVTAAAALGVVTITAKHKGLLGNSIDVRLGYYGESLPAGISAAISALTGGATNPSVATALANIGDERYHAIAFPYTDTANLTLIETELANRWGPTTQNDGHAFTCAAGNVGSMSTLGSSRNSKHVTLVPGYRYPNPPYELSASVCAVAAYYGQIDPARPFQTLPLAGILPPAISDRFTAAERNTLLYDGVSSLVTDPGGTVRIERLITTYQTNPAGADDTSYLDLNTVLTLSYLRADFRAYFQTKYPRHKLAGDGVRAAPGQAIMTPKLAKAEAIVKFRQWEDLGLVENIDQFKNELIVERNAQDPNRLDILLPPDLINQLITVGAKIAFAL